MPLKSSKARSAWIQSNQNDLPYAPRIIGICFCHLLAFFVLSSEARTSNNH